MIDPKLSPADVVVVFADLQVGIVDLPLTVAPDDLRRSARALARLAELFDLPSVVMTLPKPDEVDPAVLPEIVDTRSSYQHLTRTTPDSFDSKAFRQALTRLGRPTIVVCGVATEIVVQWIVLSGIAHGYTVHVVTDACGGLSPRSEHAALTRCVAAGAILTSVAALAGELAGDMTCSPGKDAVALIFDLIRS